ncbi:MAG: hypothetical protein WAV90_04035 [Gordonia amarae]
MSNDADVVINDKAGFPAKTKVIKDAVADLRTAGNGLKDIVAAAKSDAGSFTVDNAPAPVYASTLTAIGKWADALCAAITSAGDSADATADTAQAKYAGFLKIDDRGSETVQQT